MKCPGKRRWEWCGWPTIPLESTEKPTEDRKKYYEERQKKQLEIQAKYKKEIDRIRKKGDKTAGEALQKKIDDEVYEWSREYLNE